MTKPLFKQTLATDLANMVLHPNPMVQEDMTEAAKRVLMIAEARQIRADQRRATRAAHRLNIETKAKYKMLLEAEQKWLEAKEKAGGPSSDLGEAFYKIQRDNLNAEREYVAKMMKYTSKLTYQKPTIEHAKIAPLLDKKLEQIHAHASKFIWTDGPETDKRALGALSPLDPTHQQINQFKAWLRAEIHRFAKFQHISSAQRTTALTLRKVLGTFNGIFNMTGKDKYGS